MPIEAELPQLVEPMEPARRMDVAQRDREDQSPRQYSPGGRSSFRGSPAAGNRSHDRTG